MFYELHYGGLENVCFDICIRDSAPGDRQMFILSCVGEAAQQMPNYSSVKKTGRSVRMSSRRDGIMVEEAAGGVLGGQEWLQDWVVQQLLHTSRPVLWLRGRQPGRHTLAHPRRMWSSMPLTSVLSVCKYKPQSLQWKDNNMWFSPYQHGPHFFHYELIL